MLDRRIELLRVLAHVGTITEAAHLLYRSPSGYSRQLRGLADELGVQLLEQHGREVRLTSAARRVVNYADDVLATWEETRTSLLEESATGGTLRLGAHPTALSALIAPNMGKLAELHPRLDVELTEAEAPSCFDQLVAGQLDACIVPTRAEVPPARDRRFHQRALAVEPIDALVPSHHQTATADRVTLDEFRDCLWILPGPDRSGHQEVLSACHSAGFTPEPLHYAQDTQCVADLVEATGAVSLTSRFADYSSPAVRVPLSGDPAPQRQLLICTPAGREASQPIATLIHLVTTMLAEGGGCTTSDVNAQVDLQKDT